MAGRLAIGLTGGIGSGKSTVARLLVARGAALVDTDAIARALTAPGGAAMPALVATFGAQIAGADGALERDAMRRLAFDDPQARLRLEAVLHPMIGAEAQRQASASHGDVIVFDVPLLAESRHWRARVDRVLVVDCNAPTQIARVLQRAGWTRDAAERVIAQQATRMQRRAIADAVIHNDDGLTLEALAHEVDRLLTLWRVGAAAQ
jgi:dephospho-CoA kinase